MPPQAFACPLCNRRMGVQPELLGRKIRCPHCKQVIQAPAADQAGTPAPPGDLPTFNLPAVEAESIFGEHEHTDDVFGSARARVVMPNDDAGAAGQPEPVPVPPPAAGTTAAPSDGAAGSSSRGRGYAASRGAGGGSWYKPAVCVLLPYALLATVLAGYGLFVKPTGKVPDGHPLSLIPDNFGGFDPARRKDVSQATVPLDGPLPPELKVALGGKLAVGQVTVEPLAVEGRNIHIVTESATGTRTDAFPGKALTLTLRVTNTSADLILYPMDPAFTRKHAAGSRANPPGTGLVVGGQTFWGGESEWPPRNPAIKRQFEIAQEADATPLEPGQGREYVVTTDARADVLRAVRAATERMLWRVQVRRGLVAYRGKDVPVTAVVGVEFNPADVTGLN